MLTSLAFIYINWFDIWVYISYNCTLKILSSGLQWYLHISWHLNWRRLNVRAHEEISRKLFFFLLKEVMPVKYKLFLLRNIHFNSVVFWSSTERHIHHITAWSTWILNMWCLVSKLTLKDNGKILNFFFSFCFKVAWSHKSYFTVLKFFLSLWFFSLQKVQSICLF